MLWVQSWSETRVTMGNTNAHFLYSTGSGLWLSTTTKPEWSIWQSSSPFSQHHREVLALEWGNRILEWLASWHFSGTGFFWVKDKEGIAILWQTFPVCFWLAAKSGEQMAKWIRKLKKMCCLTILIKLAPSAFLLSFVPVGAVLCDRCFLTVCASNIWKSWVTAEVWEGQTWRFLGFQGNCSHLPAIALPFLEISAPHPHFPCAMRMKALFPSLALPDPTEDFFFSSQEWDSH